MPELLQVAVQLAHAVLGAPEHDRAAVLVKDVAEDAELESSVGLDQAMLQQRRAFSHELDPERVAQVLVDHGRDPLGHRRGGQNDLRLVRHAEDPFHVRRKAGIEHLVGLVEDEILDAAQRKQLLGKQVQDPARRSDHDVDAALQSLLLLVVADPSIEEGAA